MSSPCRYCGESFVSLSRHWATAMPCGIASGYLAPPPPPPPPDEPCNATEEEDHNVLITIGRGLAKLFVRHGCHHTAIQDMIATTKAALSNAASLVLSDVLQLGGFTSVAKKLKAILEKRLSIFDSLETAHKQLKFIKKSFGETYVEPMRLFLGERTYTYTDEEDTIHTYKEKEAYAVTFDLSKEVVRLMTASTEAHDAIVETSHRWRRGTRVLPPPRVIADITHASNFLEHPLLVDPQEDDVLIVPIVLSADAVETCNPM